MKGFIHMFDQTDMKIVKLLMENSRMQWREIGEIVHLTGQAVSNRIGRMESLGVIEGYSLKVNWKRLGKETTAFVTVFMKTTDHKAFQKYLKNNDAIIEAHRISGEGCYLLKIIASDQSELIGLLDQILEYGNYRVNLSIEEYI
ncbi:MAG: Lrp/AsnC family transcriptional regulator [Bacillota bacterium]|nr:Lrp/AsnC family transcriptional regulator [Bacillota bacterium]